MDDMQVTVDDIGGTRFWTPEVVRFDYPKARHRRLGIVSNPAPTVRARHYYCKIVVIAL